MAKRRSYKRRGSRHADSSYRRGSRQKIFDDREFSATKSERLADGEKRVEGLAMPLDKLIMTKRGKRIHIADSEVTLDKKKWHTYAALCGAGRPNKEFPKGSAIPLEAKLSRKMSDAVKDAIQRAEEDEDADFPFQATCYRCIKLQYMRDMSGYVDEQDKPIEVVTRDFFPTNKGNRNRHIMVPGGRGGFFGSGRYGDITENDEGQLVNYYQYFDDSEWVPGIEESRTQPASLAFLGNRSAEEIYRILQFQSEKEMFGVLIRNVLGREVYDGLQPAGNKVDSDTAYDKLINLTLLRRAIAEQAYDRASARGRASRKNPLLGLNEDLLDGIEMFVRSNYVRKRR